MRYREHDVPQATLRGLVAGVTFVKGAPVTGPAGKTTANVAAIDVAMGIRGSVPCEDYKGNVRRRARIFGKVRRGANAECRGRMQGFK